MAKILCVLYDDPVDGYPTSYPRDTIPRIDHYPGGQTVPSPRAIDFTPGAAVGSVSGELGLRSVPRSSRTHPGRDLRQGGARLGVRPGAGRCRCGDLATLLARLPDRRQDGPSARSSSWRSLQESVPTTWTWTPPSPTG